MHLPDARYIIYNAMLIARPTTAMRAPVFRTIVEALFMGVVEPVEPVELDAVVVATAGLTAGEAAAGAPYEPELPYGSLAALGVELVADDPLIAAAWKAAKVLSAVGLIASTIPC